MIRLAFALALLLSPDAARVAPPDQAIKALIADDEAYDRRVDPIGADQQFA